MGGGWAVVILTALLAIAGMRLYDKYWRVEEPAPAPVKAELPGVKEIPKVLPEGPLVSEKELVKLRRAARDAQEPGERASLLSKLLAVKDPQGPRLVAEAMQLDPEPEVRVKAVNMLFDIHDKDLLKHLTRSLVDEDKGMRLAVLNALERLGDVKAASAVAEVAHSDLETDVRVAAMRVLGTLHEKARADAEARAAKQREDYENAVRERQLKERLQK